MTKESSSPSRIPEFASVEEEAAFWDTHSTADFEDEFHPVRVKFAKNLSQAVAIRFDSATLATIRECAHERGLGPSTLMRMWILERLKLESAPTEHLSHR